MNNDDIRAETRRIQAENAQKLGISSTYGKIAQDPALQGTWIDREWEAKHYPIFIDIQTQVYVDGGMAFVHVHCPCACGDSRCYWIADYDFASDLEHEFDMEIGASEHN